MKLFINKLSNYLRLEFISLSQDENKSASNFENYPGSQVK